MEGLDLSSFETVKGMTGTYFLFAEKNGAKAYISVQPGVGVIPHPVNAETMVRAAGVVVRIRLYGIDGLDGGLPIENPMPGFGTAFAMPKGGYWKVKQFFPVILEEKGYAAFVKQMKEKGTADLMDTIKKALKKNRSKLLLSDEKLQVVLEQVIDSFPLAGRVNVYKGFSFEAPEKEPA